MRETENCRASGLPRAQIRVGGFERTSPAEDSRISRICWSALRANRGQTRGVQFRLSLIKCEPLRPVSLRDTAIQYWLPQGISFARLGPLDTFECVSAKGSNYPGLVFIYLRLDCNCAEDLTIREAEPSVRYPLGRGVPELTVAAGLRVLAGLPSWSVRAFRRALRPSRTRCLRGSATHRLARGRWPLRPAPRCPGQLRDCSPPGKDFAPQQARS